MICALQHESLAPQGGDGVYKLYIL